MDQVEINYWAKIAVDLEVAGDIDSVYYEHARAIALGEPLESSPATSLHRPSVMPVSGTDGQRRASRKPLVATAERRQDRYPDFIEIDNDPG